MKKLLLFLVAIVAASELRSQCTTTVASVGTYGGPATYTIAANGFLGPFRLCGNAVLYDTMGCSNRRYYVESGCTLYLKNTFFYYVWLSGTAQLFNLGGVGDVNVYKDATAGLQGNFTPTQVTCSPVSFPTSTSCPAPTITAIRSNEAYVAISYFPNPANDQLTITNPSSIPLSVTLSDVTGRIVRRTELIEKEKTLDLAELKEGYYFIRFTSGSSILTKKVVISR
jgi:hypothetical protein